MKSASLQRFTTACSYPGTLDEPAVQRHLADYVAALGVERAVVRLNRGWSVSHHPPLLRACNEMLDDFAKRTNTAPRGETSAPEDDDTAHAMNRFMSWAIHRGWWWSWDLSWLSCTAIGAESLGKTDVLRWATPIFEAFCAGAWTLYWTDDTLYWVAKPTVHNEKTPTGRRLHRADGPALESDAEDLYFWHGVFVPSFVVVRPDLICAEHVAKETNSEVQRVMMERFGGAKSPEEGVAAYIVASGAKRLHCDDYGELFSVPLADGAVAKMVLVTNGTREPDGTFKQYALSVNPDLRPMRRLKNGTIEYGDPQADTARNAVASTYFMRGEEYQVTIRT